MSLSLLTLTCVSNIFVLTCTISDSEFVFLTGFQLILNISLSTNTFGTSSCISALSLL